MSQGNNAQAINILEVYRQEMEDSGCDFDWESAMSQIRELHQQPSRYQVAKDVYNEFWSIEIKRFGEGKNDFGDFGVWLEEKIEERQKS